MEDRVTRAVELLEKQCCRPLTLLAIAKAVNLSSSRFSHTFQQEVGVAPKQYLKRLRLQKASELAEDSALSVKEIMVAVGVGDKSHFLRDFKRVYGVTPSQMRRSAGRKRIPGLAVTHGA